MISKRIGISLYEKRIQLANGIEGNGLELWRRLFTDYEGGDEYVQLDGRTNLQNVKAITSTCNITDKLDDWQHQMLKYGGDIGPVTRHTMLLKILPESVRQKVLENDKLVGTDSIIAWIRKTHVWHRSEDILKKRHGAVSAITGATQAPVPGTGCDVSPNGAAPPTVNKELVDAVIAAVQGRRPGGRAKGGGKGGSRGQSPNPARSSFPKGNCYHCNKPGHGRTSKGDRPGCPEFAKIIEKNGGKLPEGYKGAFEKHVEDYKKKHGGKGVNAINDEELLQWLAEDDSESSDDDSVGGMPCGAIWRKPPPRHTCNPFHVEPPCTLIDTPLNNTFKPISEDDDSTSSDGPAWINEVSVEDAADSPPPKEQEE